MITRADKALGRCACAGSTLRSSKALACSLIWGSTRPTWAVRSPPPDVYPSVDEATSWPCPCQRNRPKQTQYADTACRNHTQASAEGIPPTSFPSGPRQVIAAYTVSILPQFASTSVRDLGFHFSPASLGVTLEGAIRMVPHLLCCAMSSQACEGLHCTRTDVHNRFLFCPYRRWTCPVAYMYTEF